MPASVFTLKYSRLLCGNSWAVKQAGFGLGAPHSGTPRNPRNPDSNVSFQVVRKSI